MSHHTETMVPVQKGQLCRTSVSPKPSSEPETICTCGDNSAGCSSLHNIILVKLHKSQCIEDTQYNYLLLLQAASCHQHTAHCSIGVRSKGP